MEDRGEDMQQRPTDRIQTLVAVTRTESGLQRPMSLQLTDKHVVPFKLDGKHNPNLKYVVILL